MSWSFRNAACYCLVDLRICEAATFATADGWGKDPGAQCQVKDTLGEKLRSSLAEIPNINPPRGIACDPGPICEQCCHQCLPRITSCPQRCQCSRDSKKRVAEGISRESLGLSSLLCAPSGCRLPCSVNTFGFGYELDTASRKSGIPVAGLCIFL